MKKLLIIVVAVVAVYAIGGLSVNHYKNYQNKKRQEAPKTVPLSQFQALENTVTGELKGLQADNGRLYAECQKGVAAYAKLTHNQQLQTASPICTPTQSQR